MKIKKLAVLAAAIAIPIGGLASMAAISAGTAGASGTDHVGPYSCFITGLVPPTANVVFAAPGITVSGNVSETTISKTKTTAAVLPFATPPSPGSCGTVNGSIGALTISSSNPPCSGTTTPPLGLVCTLGDFAYGSWNSFIATGASTIITGLPHPKFKIDGDTFTGTTTGAASVVGAPCLGTEAGFNITGTVAPLEGYTSFSMTACLGTVLTPVGSAGTNFLSDVGSVTVGSVQIDSTDSTVNVS